GFFPIDPDQSSFPFLPSAPQADRAQDFPLPGVRRGNEQIELDVPPMGQRDDRAQSRERIAPVTLSPFHAVGFESIPALRARQIGAAPHVTFFRSQKSLSGVFFRF